MTEIDNPFDGEAARIIHQQDVTEQQARDFVVLRYLKERDTRALAHWLRATISPAKQSDGCSHSCFSPCERTRMIPIRITLAALKQCHLN